MAIMSLYVPSMLENVTLDTISRIFAILDLGLVSRVDFRYKENGAKSAYIHFSYWFDTVASQNLREKIIRNESPVRLVYDEPHYWILLENKSKKIPFQRRERINLIGLETEIPETPETEIPETPETEIPETRNLSLIEPIFYRDHRNPQSPPTRPIDAFKYYRTTKLEQFLRRNMYKL
jgi:hypothetical protein